jgi:hypothetical protein
MKRILVLLALFASSASAQTYYFQTSFAALAQNSLRFDLFNGSGSGKTVNILAIVMQKNFASVTGVAFECDLVRTTTVGTGGSAITPLKFDTGVANLPAQVTVRSTATGGAALGSNIRQVFLHSEETNVAAQLQESIPIWPPLLPFFRWSYMSLVLHEGEGVTLKQISATTAGTYSVWVAFSVY